MCFEKNKKIILLLVFVFVIIYLLTKHNENFDPTKITYGKDENNKVKMPVGSTPKELFFDGGKIVNGNIHNSNINGSKMQNSIINNTRMNSSEINDTDINNPSINNANINNLSTTGKISFKSEKKNGNNTIGKDIFTTLSNSDPNTPDQLIIDVSGRSTIDLLNNTSHIRIGDQFLNRDILAFLNNLYNNYPATAPPFVTATKTTANGAIFQQISNERCSKTTGAASFTGLDLNNALNKCATITKLGGHEKPCIGITDYHLGGYKGCLSTYINTSQPNKSWIKKGNATITSVPVSSGIDASGSQIPPPAPSIQY